MAKDLFSQQASLYAKYRPVYPEALIRHVVSYVPHRDTAWDAATGNGQAALLLAPHFKQVYATDMSEKQIAQAVQHPAVLYSVCTAEKTAFADNCFDLITVAQAYHWFSFEDFAQEATRVGKPGCVVAVWGYGLIQAHDAALNERIREYYSGVMGAYWDPERRYVDEAYLTIPFPFRDPGYAGFSMDIGWTWDNFAGYLNTWSSLQHFIRANQYNPAEEFARDVRSFWSNHATVPFRFPLFVKTGKTNK